MYLKDVSSYYEEEVISTTLKSIFFGASGAVAMLSIIFKAW